MTTLRILALDLFARRRRIAAIVLFGVLYVLGAIAVRAIGTGEHGQVEPDILMQVGGYPLMSAFLLIGWTIGRFPLVIATVLTAGIFSGDVAAGHARLYASSRTSLLTLYFVRVLAQMIIAFILSMIVLPLFDVIILGQPSSYQIIAIVGVYVLVFGTLTAFFSTFTRADGWATIFAWIGALVWHSLLRGAMLDRIPATITQLISVLLPPIRALNAVENAFANNLAIPWGAVGYVATYALILLLAAGLVITRREI